MMEYAHNKKKSISCKGTRNKTSFPTLSQIMQANADRIGWSLPAKKNRTINTFSTSKVPVQRAKFEWNLVNFDSDKEIEFQKILRSIQASDPKKLSELKASIMEDVSISAMDKEKISGWIDAALSEKPETVEEVPLQSTIFGLDIGKDTKSAIPTVQAAYEQGFRDFDSAYSYQKGETYTLFKSWNRTKGDIRLIYKFSMKEFAEAKADLENLQSLSAVTIHTVMLHDLPGSEQELPSAFAMLQALSFQFHAKVGLSNVEELTGGFANPLNFSELIKRAESIGMQISSVENRMSPGAPDNEVRKIAKEKGIEYLGYGLQGSAGGGTCSMTATKGDEHFPIKEDPVFKSLGLDDQQTKHAILAWGRSKDVKVLAKSQNPATLWAMRSDIQHDLLNQTTINQTLDSYGAENDQTRLYAPFSEYLRPKELLESFKSIKEIAPDSMWRYYYKHFLPQNEDFFLTVLKNKSFDTKKILHYFRLKEETSKKSLSVTDFGNVFELLCNKSLDEMIIVLQEQLEAQKKPMNPTENFPDQMTMEECKAQKQKWEINEGFFFDEDIMTVTDITTVNKFYAKTSTGELIASYEREEASAIWKKVK